MKKLLKYLVLGFALVAAIITVVAAITIYKWKSYYIDERVWEGQAYGFEIGQTKEEVLNATVM